MDIAVSFDKAKNKEEAYKNVKSKITPELIAKYQVKADMSYDDDNKIVYAKGKGFDLTIEFTDSRAEISLNLGLLLKAFKSKVLETLEKQVSRVV